MNFKSSNISHTFSTISDSLQIVRSEAKSWYDDKISTKYAPEKAYDGDFTTFYSPSKGEENFLKSFLSGKTSIGTVLLTNRESGCCEHRIKGTVVMIYSTEGGDEIKVADCGEKITGAVK